MYYDQTHRKTSSLEELRDTFDVDAQHRYKLDTWNEFTWGLGYRFTQDDIDDTPSLSFQPTKRLSFDIATFYNVYDGITNDVRDETFENVYDGETYGIENTVHWAVSDRWKLAGGYTYFHENLFSSGKSSFLADDPHNQFNIRSLLNLPYRTEIERAIYAKFTWKF